MVTNPKTKNIFSFFSPYFWVSFLFFTGLYLFLITVKFDHFLYIEQHSFFACTSNFFDTFTNKPGDILKWCSEFLVQFYTFPYLGAGVLTFLLIIAFLLTRNLALKLVPNAKLVSFLLAFIPVTLMVLMFCSPFYKLTETLAYLVVAFVISGYIRLKNTPVRYGLGFVVFGILYLVSGGFSFVFIGFVVGYELFFTNNKRLNSFCYILGLIVWSVVLPYSARFWGFYMSNENAYLNLLLKSNEYFYLHKSYIDFEMIGSFAKLNYLVLFLVGYIFFFPSILICAKKMPVFVSKWKKIVICGVFAVFSGFSVYAWGIHPLQDKYEKVCVLAECEKWESIWDLGSSYFFEQSRESEGFYAAALAEYTKLSAVMTRRLGEDYSKLLSYSGFETLFLDPPESMWAFYNPAFSVDFYYNLGLLVLARQEVYNVTEYAGMQNRLIRRMVQANIALGDTVRNLFYANLLDKTLFQKHFLENFEKDSLYLAHKRLLSPDRSFRLELNPSDLVIMDLAEIAPSNPYALEYACACTLLYFKDEQFLLNHLQKFKKLNYEHLPTFFEEALIVSSGYGINSEITQDSLLSMDFEGFFIRPKTIQRAMDFFNYLQGLNQGIGNLKSLENKFNDTYFFHKFIRQDLNNQPNF